jgi:hypothetical protein
MDWRPENWKYGKSSITASLGFLFFPPLHLHFSVEGIIVHLKMASSKQPSEACHVCKDVQGTQLTLELDRLRKSAEVTKCHGCQFLSLLTGAVYQSIYGEMAPSTISIGINAFLAGPNHLLTIPLCQNLFTAQGAIEVFKEPGQLLLIMFVSHSLTYDRHVLSLASDRRSHRRLWKYWLRSWP